MCVAKTKMLISCAVTVLQIVGFLMQRHMSRLMGKPDIYLRENKDADQLCSNCEADLRLCFHYIDGTIPLVSKSEI